MSALRAGITTRNCHTLGNLNSVDYGHTSKDTRLPIFFTLDSGFTTTLARQDSSLNVYQVIVEHSRAVIWP